MENIGKAVLAIRINLEKPNFFLGSLKKYKNPFSLPVKMCQMTSQINEVVSNSGRDFKWLFQVKGKIKIVKFKTLNLELFYYSANFQFEQTYQ